jgi:hypothetical protein
MRCGLATMMVAEHPKTTIQVIRAAGAQAIGVVYRSAADQRERGLL